MSICPKHSWESYSYRTEQGLVVATFHAEATKIDQSQFPLCARVQITIKDPNANGGPSREEAEVLWDMEDRLVEALDAANAPCLLLGRLTHGGLRELVFQVADYAPFRPPVGRWLMAHGDYETEVSEHDGWEFFFASVWPSETEWLQIMDRRVVDNLANYGSDTSKPHSLEFVFRGNLPGLQQMQSALETRGYRLLEFSPEQFQLVMARLMVPDPGAIFQESLSHRELCSQLGLEYDGWSASVVS